MKVSEYTPLYGLLFNFEYLTGIDGKKMTVNEMFDNHPDFKLTDIYIDQLDTFDLFSLQTVLKEDCFTEKIIIPYLRDMFDEYRQSGGNPFVWLHKTFESVNGNPQNYKAEYRGILEKTLIEWIDNFEKQPIDLLDNFKEQFVQMNNKQEPFFNTNKNNIKQLPQLEDVFFVHYQCDNFEDGNQITSLSIFANDKTIEFYNDTESENIEKYCKKVFELCNSGLIPIHWGQNKTYYGIDHIISRYKELTGKTIELEYNNNINLSRWLIYAYGERYIAHPRLDNLAILNEFNGITNKESKIFHTNRLVLLTKIYYNALNNTLKTESKPLDLSDTSTVENKIIVIKEPYGEMFSNNGFELFEHLLNEHVKPKETKGRKSDLIYYYWEMYNSKTQYIHQRPATFFKWFDEKYNETTGQLKTYNNVKTPQRIKDYSTALDWFKSKNKECTVSVP